MGILRGQLGHGDGLGRKTSGLGWLQRALGLLGGDVRGDALGQVAPAVDLLHGSDEDALANGQQMELGKVEAGDVAHAAFRVGEQAQDAVVVNIGHAGALGPGAEDDDVLDRLGRERKFERDGAADVGNSETHHRVSRKDWDRPRGWHHAQAEGGQMDLALDGEFVARQARGYGVITPRSKGLLASLSVRLGTVCK